MREPPERLPGHADEQGVSRDADELGERVAWPLQMLEDLDCTDAVERPVLEG
jgi:hypothetical protein